MMTARPRHLLVVVGKMLSSSSSSSSSSSPSSSSSLVLFRPPFQSLTLPPFLPFISSTLLKSQRRRLPTLRAFSSVSDAEWKDPSRPLPIDESLNPLLEVQLEKQSRVVPVKAYFLCKGIDLKGLQSQNADNVVPQTSRAANYVVLKFSDFRDDLIGLEHDVSSESRCCFMVVFQYGSVVLFNVPDHEVDGYLQIVEKYASGMLSGMKKDGNIPRECLFFAVNVSWKIMSSWRSHPSRPGCKVALITSC